VASHKECTRYHGAWLRGARPAHKVATLVTRGMHCGRKLPGPFPSVAHLSGPQSHVSVVRSRSAYTVAPEEAPVFVAAGLLSHGQVCVGGGAPLARFVLTGVVP